MQSVSVLPNGDLVRFGGDTHQERVESGHGSGPGVGECALNNEFLAFGISVAFAGPLLDVLGIAAGGGFNLLSDSSSGKSTILYAAASMWGDPYPLPSWRATGNGLEAIAATRNDGFLCLDEMSQVDAREVGNIAYMLANGRGKATMNQNRELRRVLTWRLIFLSSGEVGVEGRMSEGGQKVRAGMEVRVPDVPLPADGGFSDPCGFMDAKGCADFGALSRHIQAEACRNYGTPILDFLSNLDRDRRTNEAGLREEIQGWMATWKRNALAGLKGEIGAQVDRVADRFALVAAAGRLATEYGVMPWAPSTASVAARTCFAAWAAKRGHVEASEAQRGANSVVDALDKYQESRFSLEGDDAMFPAGGRPITRWGVRRPIEGPGGSVVGYDFFVTPGGWAEICSGQDPKAVATTCIAAGILAPDSEGKASRVMRVNKSQPTRWYVIPHGGLTKFKQRDGGVVRDVLDDVVDADDDVAADGGFMSNV